MVNRFDKYKSPFNELEILMEQPNYVKYFQLPVLKQIESISSSLDNKHIFEVQQEELISSIEDIE